MKNFTKIIALITIIVICFGVMAGCIKNNNNNIKGIEKPDFEVAMKNYNECNKKKSVFDANLKFTLFLGNGDPVEEITFGQHFSAKRIQNEEQIYMDATLCTADVSQNLKDMLDSVTSFMESRGEEVNLGKTFQDYLLDGTTQYTGKLGVNSYGDYNAKGDYHLKTEEPDYLDENGHIQWVGMNESSMANIQTSMGIANPISLKDYLMYSTSIDFSEENHWITADSGDLYYNQDEENFNYSLTTKGTNLRNIILQMFSGTADRFNEEDYASDLELFDDVFDTFSSWVYVHDTVTNAKVSKEGQLQAFSSGIMIDINMDKTELISLLKKIMPDEEDKTTITMISLGLSLLGFSSPTGDTDIFTVRVEFDTNEQFYYDDASIDLSTVDQDLFLSGEIDNEDRYFIRINEQGQEIE